MQKQCALFFITVARSGSLAEWQEEDITDFGITHVLSYKYCLASHRKINRNPRYAKEKPLLAHEILTTLSTPRILLKTWLRSSTLSSEDICVARLKDLGD